MKKTLLLFSFFAAAFTARSQSMYFPPLTGDTWDTISPASLGWCPDKVDELLDYLGDRNSKAFILLKDGKIVIEKYFGTFTQDSVWYWASAGKTLTSFMVGVAQQEGHLSISDTTSQYLGAGWTNCTAGEEEKITIRHQLTMTTGLDDNVPDHYCTLDTCLNCIAAPGTRWAYHNGPYTLLDGVIQDATGQTLNAYMNQKLKIPTGMTGLFIPAGYNNVFYSKARSMARFGLLILNRGNWNGNQIMTDTTYFDQMVNTSQALNSSYGYLWWLNGKSSYMLPGLQFNFTGPLSPNAPDDMIAALGKNGQLIDVAPGMDLVFIRMGNDPGVGEVPALINDTIWIKLNDLMCNTAVKEEPQLQVNVYPNPAKDVCTVDIDEQSYGLSLFDEMGRQVLQKQNCSGRTDLNVKALIPGVYYMRIVTAKNYTLFRKIVIS